MRIQGRCAPKEGLRRTGRGAHWARQGHPRQNKQPRPAAREPGALRVGSVAVAKVASQYSSAWPAHTCPSVPGRRAPEVPGRLGQALCQSCTCRSGVATLVPLGALVTPAGQARAQPDSRRRHISRMAAEGRRQARVRQAAAAGRGAAGTGGLAGM